MDCVWNEVARTDFCDRIKMLRTDAFDRKKEICGIKHPRYRYYPVCGLCHFLLGRLLGLCKPNVIDRGKRRGGWVVFWCGLIPPVSLI